jgi:hypothetical protein
MYTGINTLRHIQTQQRARFIEGLVVAEDIQGAAQRTVLDAIIDRTVTTTMGGCIKGMIPWLKLIRDEPSWLTDLQMFLSRHRFVSQTVGYVPGGPLPGPGVNEVTLYSAEYFCGPPLAYHTLSFVPYTHVCWFCLPPIAAECYDDGHLGFMRFSDGYTIQLDHPEAEKELLEETEPKALPGDVAEVPRHTRSVLFAMCGIGQHKGCSGKIVDHLVTTTCSCECHQAKEEGAGRPNPTP